MKRLLMVTLFLVVASVPAYADIQCYSYIDSQPYDDGYNNNWCWLSGGFCAQCVDVARGRGCAANQPCDPDSPRIPAPRYQLAQRSPAKSDAPWHVATAARKGRAPHTANSIATRPVSMRLA